MAIGAPNLHRRSTEAIKETLFEILTLGLQETPPEHPMLILDDLFQAGLKEKLKRVEATIMSRPRDITRIEPRIWRAIADPAAYFNKGEILLLNQPHHQTGQPTSMFTAVFTKKQMEELVTNRKGRVFWYVVSFKEKIA